ncbi:hypothetical protein CONPUDRAFT_132908 [Coniophora puteana RWD-64-598 SS2]|uniref:Queuosine 5'-phosphate N-glycosylase/hydrolase n=1 Tax=Coniophora puteana (strain RWD-64-598) TaxID=741705 RepID=R7SFZ8_CONPW|nr:uncharacterized protein CONPUDRAFT_132908 [Coniophora puteana RWD-64-598 SS2]EIW74667.1 hypothetical protein CONPUDRAFT_132908 [Coniophora puteana RWD-64-598 SS2]
MGDADAIREQRCDHPNPVVISAEYALQATNLVQINDDGVKAAARYIASHLASASYTPRTWRTHPLHLLPPEPYDPHDPATRRVLDWLFVVASLNFSFWSDRDDQERYGVEWREGWDAGGKGEGEGEKVVHTGYWSLVAALDRAIEEGIPITEPAFYASPERCPDAIIEHVFRPARECGEKSIPLLKERIAILREVGRTLCEDFDGSYQNFINAYQEREQGQGTALGLVNMVVNTFPSFRDECLYEGHKIHFWKRAQILVAETWAAFYPPPPPSPSSQYSPFPAPSNPNPHPLFPGPAGPRIRDLTMFADYRVPQIMAHLRILSYPDSLTHLLKRGELVPHGSREEVSLRSGSIVGVERVKEEIVRIREDMGEDGEEVSSVLIDFYLWDLAKRIEQGEDRIEGIDTTPIGHAHRTRSVWY